MRRIFKCKPLNWVVEKKYWKALEGEDNPDRYFITIGSIDDMWQASFKPETMKLSFSSMHYSDHEVYRFKVESIEEASEMVKKFAIGMDRWNDMIGTIYLDD